MTEPFRVYKTKAEWDHQARIFLCTGFLLGFLIGALLINVVWLLSSI